MRLQATHFIFLASVPYTLTKTLLLTPPPSSLATLYISSSHSKLWTWALTFHLLILLHEVHRFHLTIQSTIRAETIKKSRVMMFISTLKTPNNHHIWKFIHKCQKRFASVFQKKIHLHLVSKASTFSVFTLFLSISSRCFSDISKEPRETKPDHFQPII